MTGQQLTGRMRLARTGAMQEISNEHGSKVSVKRLAAPLLASLVLAGCITVNAPEEPIVIELNVNIRQEVIYRLAADAGNTIEENADIF